MADSTARAESDIPAGKPFDQVDCGEFFLYGDFRPGEPLAQRQLLRFHGRSEETIMPYLRETRRQDMEQEAADELIGGKRHHFLFRAVFVIAPLERNLIIIYAYDAVVGDGDAVSIPSKVFDDGQACFKWAFAVDIPVFGIKRIGGGAPYAVIFQPLYFMPSFLQSVHELSPEQ